MQTLNIFTNEFDSLPEGKADFLLAASVTKTCEIEGITQAGIPGKIALTPTLDAELLSSQKLYSLPELASTPSGVPSPALITRGVHNLTPFSNIEILNLGLLETPQACSTYSFGVLASNSIVDGAAIDAKELFYKGMQFGKSYELRGNYLMLGESTPSGTTTAAASLEALGYDCKDALSSSFLNAPKDIKNETISKALSLVNEGMSSFEKLSLVSDNMLVF